MRGLYVWLLWLAPHALELAIILTPLTIYLLFLGMDVNSRKRPVVWTGRRNVAWLAFALSGFFLAGPPTWVLAKLQWEGPPWFYFAGYGIYVALLAWLLRRWLARQRRRLVIFNIAPHTLARLLPEVLGSLPGPQVFGPGRAILAGGKLAVDLDASATWFAAELDCHTDDPALIEALRERLEETLAEATTPPHAARRFLSWLGALLAILSTQAVMLFLWYVAH